MIEGASAPFFIPRNPLATTSTSADAAIVEKP